MKDLWSSIGRAFQRGGRQAEIFRRLNFDGVLRQLISKTIRKWRETGSIGLTGPGLFDLALLVRHNFFKKSDSEFVEIVVARRESSQQHWTRRVQLLNEYSRMTSYWSPTNVEHGLPIAQKKKLLIRCKRLLRRFTTNRMKSIALSDEKIFVVEEQLNK